MDFKTERCAGGDGWRSHPLDPALPRDYEGQREQEMLAPNDIVEHLACTYVYAVATHAGCSYDRTTVDRDSIDARLQLRLLAPEEGLSTPGIDLQIKGYSLDEVPSDEIAYDLSIKNYDDLRRKSMTPRLLVVVLVPVEPAQRVTISAESLTLKRLAFWLNLLGEPDSQNDTKQRVKIPMSQVFEPTSLRRMMDLASKQERLA